MSDNLNPYQSPGTAGAAPQIDVAPPGDGRPVIPFASGAARAKWTIALLAIEIVMALLSAASGYLEIGLLTRADAGGAITQEEADANDARQATIGILGLVVYVGSAIAFLMWFHRAHRNLPALGNQYLRYTPGWAVGAWFVPILNFFRPCQIMAEVSRGSDPAPLEPERHWNARARVSSWVGLWWASWIIMGVIGQVAFRLMMRAETPPAMLAADWISLAADLISVPAALLAILVVRSVDLGQSRRYWLLQQNAEAQPPDFGSPFASPS